MRVPEGNPIETTNHMRDLFPATHEELSGIDPYYRGKVLERLESMDLVGPEGVQFRNPLLGHPNSQAHYLVDLYPQEGFDRVLVSYLRPESVTSRHFHPEPITEEYYRIDGVLYVNGEPIPDEGREIPVGLIHQARTENSYALTLIVMRRAGLIPSESQHIYVPSEGGEQTLWTPSSI